MRHPFDRFWENVTRCSHGLDCIACCWLWNKSKHQQGYGQLHIGNALEGQQLVRAHRYSWIIAHGAIPAGAFVCHSCDNPPCVNPAHLWLGTQKENRHDAQRKGRLGKNWVRPAKLSHEAVTQIRQLSSEGMPGKDLALCFHVSTSLISRILHGTRRQSVKGQKTEGTPDATTAL